MTQMIRAARLWLVTFECFAITVTPNTQAREPGYLRIRPLVLTTTNKVIVDLV